MQGLKTFLTISLLLFSLSSAHAFYAVCGNGNDGVGPQDGFRTDRTNLDPAHKPADCYFVDEAQIPSQQALVRSTDRRKLKIDTVNNLAVLKSASSQATIDDMDQASQAASQQLNDQLTSNDLCNTSNLATLQTRLNTVITGLNTIADMKTFLSNALFKIISCVAAVKGS